MNSQGDRISQNSEDNMSASSSSDQDSAIKQLASLKLLLSSPKPSSNGGASPASTAAAGNGKSSWRHGLRKIVRTNSGKQNGSSRSNKSNQYNIDQTSKLTAVPAQASPHNLPTQTALSAEEILAKALASNETVSPEAISPAGLLEALIADAEKHLHSSNSTASNSNSTASSSDLGFGQLQELEILLSSIFSAVVAIRDAYTHLQSAHAACDSQKLDIADKAVVSELRRLSDLEKAYREKTIRSSNYLSSYSSSPCASESGSSKLILKSYEGLISNFHSDIEQKNVILEKLKDKLAQSTLEKEKLEHRVKRLEQKLSSKDTISPQIKSPPQNDKSFPAPSVELLESVIMQASEASRNFTKLLMSLMQMTNWDLHAAAEAIQPGIDYADPKYRKFAFQSFVRQRMLIGFESENFFLDGSIPTVFDPEAYRKQCFKEFKEFKVADPVQIVSDDPNGMFGRYCLSRFQEVIHSKMEEVFFGNLDMRQQIQQGIHPKSHFYHSFLQLAKTMWVLHRLAFSFQPNVRIFQVLRGTNYSPMYMESVVQMEPQSSSNGVDKVGFTVMPGWLWEKTVIKCQVYIPIQTRPQAEAPPS